MALTKVIGAGLGTLTEDLLVTGTTPKITIGDAGAEDTAIIFDGNAQDFYIGLDDTNDNLSIGLGSTIGSTQLLKFTSGDIIINEDSADINFRVEGNGDTTLLKCDAGEDNVKIKTDNNYAALVIENDDAGSQERALYASVTATSGTSANNVALFSATHSNMTNPLVRIHHEDPSADQLLIQATTTGSNTVKFSVDEDGDAYVAGGLLVGGTGTANLLDDYEEGEWTAVFNSSGASFSHTYSKGYYTKIGNRVIYHCHLQLDGSNTFSSNYVTIDGLPFTSTSTAGNISVSIAGLRYVDLSSGANFVEGRINNNNNYIQLYEGGDNYASSLLLSNQLSSSSGQMSLSGSYITSS
mgnify:CR=1 FL=1